jgi:hypothetical protein
LRPLFLEGAWSRERLISYAERLVVLQVLWPRCSPFHWRHFGFGVLFVIPLKVGLAREERVLGTYPVDSGIPWLKEQPPCRIFSA